MFGESHEGRAGAGRGRGAGGVYTLVGGGIYLLMYSCAENWRAANVARTLPRTESAGADAGPFMMR